LLKREKAMTILLPTKLELIDHRQQGWNAIVSSNVEKINDYFKKLWGGIEGNVEFGSQSVDDLSVTLEDPIDITQTDLIDSSSGASSNTILMVSGSGDDGTINDNFASVQEQLSASKADAEELREKLISTIDYCNSLENKVNELLKELRVSTGTGILGD